MSWRTDDLQLASPHSSSWNSRLGTDAIEGHCFKNESRTNGVCVRLFRTQCRAGQGCCRSRPGPIGPPGQGMANVWSQLDKSASCSWLFVPFGPSNVTSPEQLCHYGERPLSFLRTCDWHSTPKGGQITEGLERSLFPTEDKDWEKIGKSFRLGIALDRRRTGPQA
jgi:hypothetical protein